MTDLPLEKTGFHILLLTISISTSRRHKSGLDGHEVTQETGNGFASQQLVQLVRTPAEEHGTEEDHYGHQIQTLHHAKQPRKYVNSEVIGDYPLQTLPYNIVHQALPKTRTNRRQETRSEGHHILSLYSSWESADNNHRKRLVPIQQAEDKNLPA